MSHRRLAAAAAAAAGLAIAVTPAIAHAAPTVGPPPLTVLVGGNATQQDYPVQGTNKGDVTLTANGIPLTCTMSTLGGLVHAGPSPDGLDVADITGATFTDCTLNKTLPATVTANNFSWPLNITNVTGTNMADGNVTHIGAHVDVNVAGIDCAFDVTGTVNGSIGVQPDGTQELVTTDDATLTLSNVSAGCLGLVSNGSSASFEGDYDVTIDGVANPPISFTNP